MDELPVFTPTKLRHRTLQHRITFGAHTSNMADDGLAGERHLHYYRERAAGGAAMIVVEPMPVHGTAVLTRGNFRVQDDAVIAGFRRIAETCHEHGSTVLQQLYHVGQHADAANSFMPNWSPSGLPSFHDSDGSHAMTESEIEESIAGFVAAAMRVQAAGFDGVEIFAAYSALVDQFWSPWSNRRDDRWGGSLENRLRFSAELLQRIRAKAGDAFIIGLAVSVNDESPAMLSLDEQLEILDWHDQRGLMDYVSVGTGSYFDSTNIIPTSFAADQFASQAVASVKRQLRHALVQAESQVRTFENAASMVAAGEADLVSIVRGQIADPGLVHKAKSGNAEQIRPCVSCNQLCRGRRNRDYWISCMVNPATGREQSWSSARLSQSQKQAESVAIIGAGPAGLECARYLAEAGCRVQLFERSDAVGGQLQLAARQPTRQRWQEYLSWCERELKRLSVDVELDTSLSVADVQALSADAVVIATGSEAQATGYQRALPHIDRLPGVESSNVATVHRALQNGFDGQCRIAVLDDLGDWKASGTALQLARQGHTVTLITAGLRHGWSLANTGVDRPLIKALAEAGVSMLTSTVALGWQQAKLQLRSLLTGEEISEEYDCLVVSNNTKPDETFNELLTQDHIHAIGDVVAARTAAMAIYEAHALARWITFGLPRSSARINPTER